MAQSRKPTSTRALKLASYSSAAVGAFALASDVEGAIIPYIPDPTGRPVVLGLGDSFDIDVDGDQIVDYTIDVVSHNYLGAMGALFEIAGATTSGFQNLASHNYDDPDLGNYVGFANYHDVAGYEIGPDVRGWHDRAPIFSTASEAGDFFGARGWLGLYFEIPGGSPHFGFLDLEGTPDSLYVHGGGFESQANTPIRTASEPGSLALLALGAGGLAAWRRRSQRRPPR